MTAPKSSTRSDRARQQSLETASSLFYQYGVRAIGMEEIVEKSGIAKTTIYRHFPSKDALVEAFLEKEDAEFWEQWTAVTSPKQSGRAQLFALCDWIGERVQRDNYRGCPQINVAAEFADISHPARVVSRRHKNEMRLRIAAICKQDSTHDADQTAMQIALLFDGAFMSDGRLGGYDAAALLRDAVARLLKQTAI